MYGIIKCESKGRLSGKPFLVGVFYSSEYGVAHNFEYDIQRRKLTCYRVINEKQISKKPKNMKSIPDFSGRYYTTKGDCPICGAEGLYRSTATLFQNTLDQIAVQEATTGWMDANAGQVIYNGGAEVKIPKMNVQGMGNYDRDNGYQMILTGHWKNYQDWI